MEGLGNPVFGKLKAFKRLSQAAQTIILENGGWNRFNEWMKTAIASKDVPLILEILEVVEKMTTTFSQLTGPGGKLTATVEKLLKNTVSGKSMDFGREASEKLKVKCAEVFAKWLRLKKKRDSETTPPLKVGESVQLEIGVGEVIGEIAPIGRGSRFGVLAIEGKISVVEIIPFPTPPTSLCDMESSSEKSETVLVLDGLHPPRKVPKMSAPVMAEIGGTTSTSVVNSLAINDTATFSSISCHIPTKNLPSVSQLLETFSKRRGSIGNPNPIERVTPVDMEPSKKSVSLWGLDDGVHSVHSYEANEDHERLGTVKEKWISFSLVDLHDEDNLEVIPMELNSLEDD